MISNTEALVIGIMIAYTLVIIIGLNRYESRIKNLNAEIEWLYDRSFKNKPSNAQHYTQLQIENQSLRKSLYELDRDNELLKRQLGQVRLELLESRPLQNESSIHQVSLFESQIDFE